MFRRSRLALIAALAALLTLGLSAEPSGRAQFIDAYTWRVDDPSFGGFSGLELSGNGLDFVTVSDRAHIARGRLLRRDGRITGVADLVIGDLGGPGGRELLKREGDSEGLAIAADGTPYISFEGRNRIVRYGDGEPTELPGPPAFTDMQENSGLEALAMDKRGWLYTLPERSGALTRDFPVFRFRNGVWDQPFSISRSGGFLPVGADFGPDGRLYLLERNFTGLNFLSRIRRFDVTETMIGRGDLVMQSDSGQFDNLEGLSVWRDDAGRIRLTMISDDNFQFFQHTQFVEFALPD